jgi:hypothetical protein
MDYLEKSPVCLHVPWVCDLEEFAFNLSMYQCFILWIENDLASPFLGWLWQWQDHHMQTLDKCQSGQIWFGSQESFLFCCSHFPACNIEESSQRMHKTCIELYHSSVLLISCKLIFHVYCPSRSKACKVNDFLTFTVLSLLHAHFQSSGL